MTSSALAHTTTITSATTPSPQVVFTNSTAKADRVAIDLDQIVNHTIIVTVACLICFVVIFGLGKTIYLHLKPFCDPSRPAVPEVEVSPYLTECPLGERCPNRYQSEYPINSFT